MASVIIVAAGKGIRMNHSERKQYLLLGDLPILAHTLLAFDACEEIKRILLVLPKEDIGFCHKTVVSPLKLRNSVELIPGGRTRQDSVRNGLMAVGPGDDRIVLIHDGVRPFVRPEQMTACINTAKESGSCILGIPAYDTLKKADSSGRIERTLERSAVWLAQTPQAFQYDLIITAHEAAKKENYTGTDDASLVERLGETVTIIKGSRFNIKITTPEDLILAKAIIEIVKRET